MPYDERLRNNFIIDEKQFMENYQNYEISMGVNDISNIFIPTSPTRISRSNSIDSLNNLMQKNNSITNLFNSMNSKLFSHMSSKNNNNDSLNNSRNNSRIFDNSYNMNFI